MADIHTIELTIVIDDPEKWNEPVPIGVEDHWGALVKVSDVVSKAAYEYMSKYPSVYPNPEFNG